MIFNPKSEIRNPKSKSPEPLNLCKKREVITTKVKHKINDLFVSYPSTHPRSHPGEQNDQAKTVA
jgi:hypothetical protein